MSAAHLMADDRLADAEFVDTAHMRRVTKIRQQASEFGSLRIEVVGEQDKPRSLPYVYVHDRNA